MYVVSLSSFAQKSTRITLATLHIHIFRKSVFSLIKIELFEYQMDIFVDQSIEETFIQMFDIF